MRLAISIVCGCSLVLAASSQAGSQREPVSGNLRVPSPVSPRVRIVALPDGGIQPHAVVDPAGTTHVLYFAGDPAGGDLYYFSVSNQTGKPSTPVPVNSVAGSALAAGSVRGGQLALGRNGRVHVAWHGSKPLAGTRHVPMWYSRSTGDGPAFEPQRVVSGSAAGLDGGSVAADRSGQVAVAWHADGNRVGDGHRTVYLATSANDGATFLSPAPATAAPVGACGCCGMRALFDRAGGLHVLYRAATDGKHRDTMWLRPDLAIARAPVRVHPWDIEACPMTTYALVETADGLAAAWETAQQIYTADLNPATSTVSTPSPIPGRGSRKHPSIAVNKSGDRLIAWTEGTAWKRGGTFAWRLTDRTGNQRAAEPNAGNVGVWGLVSAVAMPDGSFLIYR